MSEVRRCPRCGAMVRVRNQFVSDIQAVVAQHYGIQPRELCGPSLLRRLTGPRHVAMYLARELSPFGLRALGKMFGRDHASVIYGWAQVKARLVWDAAFAAEVAVLKAKLEPGE